MRRQRIDQEANHCLIFLFREVSEKPELKDMASRIQEEFEGSVCIFLQIPADLNLEEDEDRDQRFFESRNTEFLSVAKEILENVIQQGLIVNCHFEPKSIVIVGRDEAASVALTVAAVWHQVEFGGIIALGGRFLSQYQPQSVCKAKTPALILQKAGMDNGGENAAIDFFDCLDFESLLNEPKASPQQRELQAMVDFLGHRLRRDEWTKQAVLSFGKLLKPNALRRV